MDGFSKHPRMHCRNGGARRPNYNAFCEIKYHEWVHIQYIIKQILHPAANCQRRHHPSFPPYQHARQHLHNDFQRSNALVNNLVTNARGTELADQI